MDNRKTLDGFIRYPLFCLLISFHWTSAATLKVATLLLLSFDGLEE